MDSYDDPEYCCPYPLEMIQVLQLDESERKQRQQQYPLYLPSQAGTGVATVETWKREPRQK
jgi:hypothetical protein